MQRFLAGLQPRPTRQAASLEPSGNQVLPKQNGYNYFDGHTYLVDLADVKVNGKRQDFEGKEWLEEQLRLHRTLGLDMEWRPDRERDSDNPIALLQFANRDTALLLRTHATGFWLPQLIKDVLKSPMVKKICVGYDSSDRRKMKNSFDIDVLGVVDLADMAPRKGLEHTGLKRMAAELGWAMRKESSVARSDWMAQSLSGEQVRYAAEDAYFTYMIYVLLSECPDVALDEEDEEEAYSVLSLKPGWADQGVVRESDGLWCRMCNKGPILHADIMEKHIQSAGHVKKASIKVEPEEQEPKPAEEVPAEFLARGIARGGEGHSRALANEYICLLCDAGPFHNLEVAAQHLRGRTHLKKEGQGVDVKVEELPTDLLEAGFVPNSEQPGTFLCSVCDAGPFTDIDSMKKHTRGRQHQRKVGGPPAPAQREERTGPAPCREDLAILPGYVDLWDGDLWCSLCAAKANNLQIMIEHLCSDRHSKMCQKEGRPEVFFVPSVRRFQELESGRLIEREDDEFDVDFIPPVLRRPSRSSTPVRAQRDLGGDELVCPPCRQAPQPLPKDLATAKAWGSWSGRASARAPEGTLDRLGLSEAAEDDVIFTAQVDVPVPSPGWLWDSANCLGLARGDTVRVHHCDGPWVFGESEGRFGWLPAWALRRGGLEHDVELEEARPVPTVEGSIDAEVPAVSVAPCTDGGTGGSNDADATVLQARVDVEVPSDWTWDPESFLPLSLGDHVTVVVLEGDWVYGRSQGRSGWVPASALGHVGLLASSGEAEAVDEVPLPVVPAGTFSIEELHKCQEAPVSLGELEKVPLPARPESPDPPSPRVPSPPLPRSPGVVLRAARDVVLPLDWPYDARSFLELRQGAALEVLAHDDDWLWASSQGRTGWLPAEAVQMAPSVDGGEEDGGLVGRWLEVAPGDPEICEELLVEEVQGGWARGRLGSGDQGSLPLRALRLPGTLHALRKVDVPAPGSGYLSLERREEFYVAHADEDGWFYGHSSSGSGWVAASAFCP